MREVGSEIPPALEALPNYLVTSNRSAVDASLAMTTVTKAAAAAVAT